MYWPQPALAQLPLDAVAEHGGEPFALTHAVDARRGRGASGPTTGRPPDTSSALPPLARKPLRSTAAVEAWASDGAWT